jgi:hypothetical protein
VLGLMTATIRHVADPRAYALVVREFVLTGSPDLNAGMDHGAFLSDTATEMPSIAKMLLAAGQIKVEAKRASFISAKTRSRFRPSPTASTESAFGLAYRSSRSMSAPAGPRRSPSRARC